MMVQNVSPTTLCQTEIEVHPYNSYKVYEIHKKQKNNSVVKIKLLQ